MRGLIVIDMQEDYVGSSRNKRRYPYKVDTLIYNINKKIAEYSPDNVIYVVNRFFWEWSRSEKKIVQGVSVVSTHIFEKRKSSCFANELINLLHECGVNEVELVGVDGNYCVGASALSGQKEGFRILFNESCVGVGKPLRFRKTRKLLSKNNIEFIS